MMAPFGSRGSIVDNIALTKSRIFVVGVAEIPLIDGILKKTSGVLSESNCSQPISIEIIRSLSKRYGAGR